MCYGAQARQSGLAGYATFMRNATSGYSMPCPSSPAPSLQLAPGSQQQQQQQQLWISSHDFMSLCEHHLLPFCGTLRVGLLLPPDGAGRQLAAAAVQQSVARFSKRLQIQERLSHQVANALQPFSLEGAVIVSCTAAHMCMIARGVEQHGSRTTTHAACGLFAREPVSRVEALQQLRTQRK